MNQELAKKTKIVTMSKHKQSSLDQFFKSTLKSPAVPTMNIKENNKKRRSLSLVKTSTPDKAPKINSTSANLSKTEPEVIDLCSDDKYTPPIQNNSNGHITQDSIHSDSSNSSQSTIKYNLTPTTPQKLTQTSSSDSFQSPSTRKKFYSPGKKRTVIKRTPAKRNLTYEYNSNSSQSQSNSVEDEVFVRACEGMDDKSIFFLTAINKCLKDANLKKLLDTRSVELLGSCLRVVKPGARLVCRLYWHQHRWYRKEKVLKIAKEKDTMFGDSQFQEMIKCLVENGLIEDSTVATSTMTFDDFSKVLKCDEMKQICKDLHMKIKSKEGAKEALRSFSQKSSISKFFGGISNNSKRVIEMMRMKADRCYKLSDLAISALYKLYLLMYLGMNYEIIKEKRLEIILISTKIGQEVYPVDKGMVLDNASAVFRSREEFESYVSAQLIYDQYLTETESSEKCKIILHVHKLYNGISDEDMFRYKTLPTWLNRYTPAYIYIKMLESGIQELKKAKCESFYQHSLDILTTLISQRAFRQHKKAEWYAEKALILHKLLARHDEAAEVLLEGLKSNLSEEAKDAMRPRANKIAHQLNIKLAPGLSEALELASKHIILEKNFPSENISKLHMESHKQRGKKKFEIHTDGEKTFLEAEDYCVNYYTSKGIFTNGEHWEGRIATTIYFLLFWDIIYTKPRGVLGVFLSHYQRYPLDIYHESFYTNRKILIDDKLTTIENMDTNTLIEIMRHKWEERPETELSGIHRAIGWDNVRMVVTCLGGKAAAAICRRLAVNFGYAHSGFPDLTLWDINTRKIKFVEVKTDTDKPSIKQLQWMQYLRGCGIDTGFCYVGAASARGGRRRAPAHTLTVRSVSDINSGVGTFGNNLEAEL